MKTTDGTAHWDGMCWYRAGQYLNDLNWRLRYGGEPSRSDILMAAEVLSCYRALVYSTEKKRREVVRNLRDAERAAGVSRP